MASPILIYLQAANFLGVSPKKWNDGRGWRTVPLILAAMLRAPQKMLTWTAFP